MTYEQAPKLNTRARKPYRLPDGFRGYRRDDPEKTAKAMLELTRLISTFSTNEDYSTPGLKQHTDALRDALMVKNSYIRFDPVEGYFAGTALTEQSTLEKIVGIVMHFGEVEYIKDVDDLRGSYITTYSFGSIKVRFISNQGFGVRPEADDPRLPHSSILSTKFGSEIAR